MLTLRDTNTTETDKVGLQPWTAVLYRFLWCWFFTKSTFLRSIYQPCSFAVVIFFWLIRTSRDRGVARIFQRGASHTVSNIIVMAFSLRNIVGCFLKKRLTKGGGGSRAPQDPPRYVLEPRSYESLHAALSFQSLAVLCLFYVYIFFYQDASQVTCH